MKVDIRNRVKANFTSQFGGVPVMTKASGRINLIGEHVDYNDGFVLPAAIDKGIVVAVGHGNGDVCQVTALDLEETYQFDTSSIAPLSGGGWRNYLLGILDEVKKRGHDIPSFNMVFAGDIPSGSGLSSSAALENAMVFSLNTLFQWGFQRKEMIRISQQAEHRFVGVKCGIMDQYASMFGKEGHFLLLDCRSVEAVPIVANLGNHELVLINTNVQHTLSDSAYNDRRAVCEAICQRLDKKALRDVTEETLQKIRDEIHESEYDQALFVLREIQRTKDAAEYLIKNDLTSLGRLMFNSHYGLRDKYRVSCDELDFLVNLAEADDSVAGARMMGGGFGGCTINLIKKEGKEHFLERTTAAYKNQFGLESSVYQVAVSKGTQLVGDI
ncbi:MAG: galactokinase [Flavobacteriaceae bacterium]